jgi:hypothetical protein
MATKEELWEEFLGQEPDEDELAFLICQSAIFKKQACEFLLQKNPSRENLLTVIFRGDESLQLKALDKLIENLQYCEFKQIVNHKPKVANSVITRATTQILTTKLSDDEMVWMLEKVDSISAETAEKLIADIQNKNFLREFLSKTYGEKFAQQIGHELLQPPYTKIDLQSVMAYIPDLKREA